MPLAVARRGSRGRARRLDPAATIAPSACGSCAVSPYEDLRSLLKTYSAKKSEIARDWYVIDADGETLGRLATRIANTLRGKRKPQYTPHVDTGDFVVVVNCERIRVTGNKLEQKIYYHHSGYPGGLQGAHAARDAGTRPDEVIRNAVKGMLPRNRLGRAAAAQAQAVRRRPEHPHEAQQPAPLP